MDEDAGEELAKLSNSSFLKRSSYEWLL